MVYVKKPECTRESNDDLIADKKKQNIFRAGFCQLANQEPAVNETPGYGHRLREPSALK